MALVLPVQRQCQVDSQILERDVRLNEFDRSSLHKDDLTLQPCYNHAMIHYTFVSHQPSVWVCLTRSL
jgi:hypothetical protein